MENFTKRFLYPLREKENKREEFGDGLDEILKHAIQLNQKKVSGMKNRTAQLIIYILSFLFNK